MGDSSTTNDRVAVVTGGASGIGLAVAERLAAAGHPVALLDRQGDATKQAATKLREAGHRAVGVEVDVSDRAAVEQAYATVRSELGPITVLVTSAGIEAFQDLLDIDDETWDRVIAVNLTGTFLCAQLAVPDMIDAGWGRIITISSSSAQSGAPRMAHYTASKGGVISLTRSLAKDLARHGITANTIPPTIVDTPMARQGVADGHVPPVEKMANFVPLGRAGTPDDIAAMCAFLASDDASYVTGQIMGVNGGMYI